MWEPPGQAPGRPKLPAPEMPLAPAEPMPAAQSTPVIVTRHNHSHSMTKRPPQGAMTKAQRSVSPAEEAAFATIEAEMGGRARLVSALSSAQLPKDIAQVLGMISDPLHDHESLAKICALGGVSLAKIQKAFEGSVMARAHLLAHTKIAERTPDLAAQVMDDAIGGWRVCVACEGVGTTMVEVKDQEGTRDEQRECPTCKGKCRVWFQPDHEVQKTALKLAKLLETGRGGGGSGVNVAMIQANTAGNPGDQTSYNQLIGKLDDVLYGSGRQRLIQSQSGKDLDRAERAERAEAMEGEESVDGEVADA